jgi:lipopolysaccharide/colanic/teichoic acid biosynthesis glycosyltransferase
MFSIVSECGGLKVEFLVSGSDLDYVVGKSAITMLDDIPLLKIEYNISSLFHVFSKRMFDLIMGVIVLLSIYPFIYLFSLFKREKGNLYNFIIKVPLIVTGLYSFVGPYSNSYYDGLFVGKKGLTGFWFIENLDTNDQDEIRKIDIYYAKNYNIWLDMEILGKTISKLFFRTEQ